jgi:hypothetical protein
MKRLENVKSIECYAYDTEHNIDIIETNETYEAWLFKRNYGFKTLMFGVPITQQSKEEFINIVTKNVLQYIPMYCEELSILEEER